MKKVFLIIILALFCGMSYAENKIYVDKEKNLEICDLDGLKTLGQINTEFKGNFTNVTNEKKAIEEQSKIVAQKKREIEDLIQSKITEKQRKEAMAELKKEGKLDNDGNIIK